MAAVLQPSDDSHYFSRMHRSSTRSQPKFSATARHASYSAPDPTRKGDEYASMTNPKIYPDSAPSSVTSSPHLGDSDDLSYASTPPTDMSLDCDETVKDTIFPEDHLIIPYTQSAFYEDLEAPTSPKTGDSYTTSPVELDNDNDTSRPSTPTCLFDVDAPVQDDTAVESQPTRHVDYLSHEWREEDIWSSWRYITSRRSEVANSARLENASWRTWAKAKYSLQTVSPEALNWLKDCDVTWLYGPLQPGSNVLGSSSSTTCKHTSKNSPYINKKPCLKKRSMSEVMLQRSLSASALVKTAAAAVQAQRKVVRPGLTRSTTDYDTFPFSLKGFDTSCTESSCSSGRTSPTQERRHIHFNEQVEQCIAVVNADEEEDDDEEDVDMDRFDDSDSEDDAVMMRRTRTKKRASHKRARKSRTAPMAIAKLPSTTLKRLSDDNLGEADQIPAADSAMKHSIGAVPVVSPSSSQETLCPPKAAPTWSYSSSSTSSQSSSHASSGNFLFCDDDDDDEAAQEAMLTGRTFRPCSDDTGFLHTSSLSAEPAGMHRTDSGMFMPIAEGTGASTHNEGVFGRVVDTVNTARDIAHVIWNVGWRQ